MAEHAEKPAELRDRAMRYRAMIQLVSDKQVGDFLERMADELDVRANEMERQTDKPGQ
jgi:hypothetical protein